MNQNSANNKSHLLSYAMHAGLLLGAFWIMNYLLIIFGHDNMMLRGLNQLFRIGTPLLLFSFLRTYNEKFVGNKLRFGHGIQFSIALFFFGSIFEAILVFAHVNWIDPSFITYVHNASIEAAKAFNFSDAFTTQLAEASLPNPWAYVLRNVFLLNTFIALILSLIIVPLVQRFKIVRNEP